MATSSKKSLYRALRRYLKELFDLHEDKERESITISEISKGVEFKGTNLWILIFAILIASIGLNVNSTAVIIGAMLISPLMGPIMGVGLGAGTNDLDLIKKAFRNLGVAVFISVATSALYFYMTPLHEARSELLSRTTPTLWDVMIAFFGGLAGIVAGSRKEKSNAIPGVAIATALMPPLCTAGYGLATMNWYFFMGAFYLFFINSVFISVATFLIVRFLGYPTKRFEDPDAASRVKLTIGFFVVLTLIPSVYLAYQVVSRTLFEQNAHAFIKAEFDFDETQVISKSIDPKKKRIDLTLFGKPVGLQIIERIEHNLPVYNLEDAQLQVRQGYRQDSLGSLKEFERISQEMKTQIIEDLYKRNEEALRSKEKQISFLENELYKTRKKYYPTEAISKELKIQYETLEEFSLSSAIIKSMKDNSLDTICLAYARFAKRPYRKELLKLEAWLKVRTQTDSVKLIVK